MDLRQDWSMILEDGSVSGLWLWTIPCKEMKGWIYGTRTVESYPACMSDQIVTHTSSEITTMSDRQLASSIRLSNFTSSAVYGLCTLGADIDHLEQPHGWKYERRIFPSIISSCVTNS